MTEDTHSKILDACFKLLCPIARVLLLNGISYKEFDSLCRRAFVLTASSEFGVRGRETNVSRVAAMTGLSRKEVQRIRDSVENATEETSDLLSPLADLLHEWATANPFKDEEGRPRVLRVRGDAPGEFSALVKKCMGDVPPGAVRTELVRLGAARMVGDDSLAMNRRTLIPIDPGARLESALIYSLRGLAETVAHNNDPRVPEADRRFERFVESRPLSEDEIVEVRGEIRKRLKAVSEELDALLSESKTNEDSRPMRRVGIGLFYSE